MRDVLVSFPPNHRPATINVKEIDSPITELSARQSHYHSSPSQEHVPETLSNNSKIHPLLALRAKGGVDRQTAPKGLSPKERYLISSPSTH